MVYALTLISTLALAVTTAVRATEIFVTVGGPGGVVAYNPPFVNANPGDVVTFTFQQKNHTVTQSTFASPCVQAPDGFDSGFQFVADNNTAGPFPTAQLTVKDTNPVWIYCRQTGHCEQGMVFAINPGSSDKFAQFQDAAMGINSTSTETGAGSVVTVTATVTVPGGGTVTTTYGSYPGSAAPTSGVSTDHQVTVGGTGKLFYSPANITAEIGDTVTFTFMQKNHTVTQSSFSDPCRALTLTSTSGQIGFDSDFQPVADNATTFPTFTIQINDTAPVWAYCRQAGHCGSGMVFAVNAVEDGPNNFAAFQALAISLNGTNATTTASGSTTSATGKSNGALGTVPVRIHAGGAMVLLGIILGVMF